MFVSTRHGVLFLANQKCGSTSISRALRPYCDITPQTEHTATHKSFHQVNNYLEGRIDLSQLVSFTTIRDPWRRVVSFYKHIHNETSRHPFWAAVARESLSFDDFIRRSDIRDHLTELAAENFCRDPQRGRWVSYILPMETVLERPPDFLSSLGISINRFPHARNQGGSNDHFSWYTPETWRIVEQIFASDIRIGGYNRNPTPVAT